MLGTIILTAILAVSAVASFVIAILSFTKKVRLITNPYLWMSQTEREREFAKVGEDGVSWLYRQQGTAFAFCTAISLLFLLDIAAPVEFPFMILMWIFFAVAMVYVITSNVKHRKLSNAEKGGQND
ncbi:MAG: hypothetical protein FWG64_00730 [Firmicutes bacterium]|nr:hypothetical protein [Bacillota bacterium]